MVDKESEIDQSVDNQNKAEEKKRSAGEILKERQYVRKIAPLERRPKKESTRSFGS
jgi:hypothetical protein